MMALITHYTTAPTTTQRSKTCHFLLSFVLVAIIWMLSSNFSGHEPFLALLPAVSDATQEFKSDQLATTNTVAVMIEDRPLETLLPLLLHFSLVLGPAWPIIFYTSQSIYPDSAPLRRAIDDHRIIVRFLPSMTQLSSRDSVSKFLTEPWLWEQLAPAEHVLLFQADSIICSNSALRVDDFLQYDFVGAPINPALGVGEGYNGGLSLRNRTMVLDIIGESSWREEKDAAKDSQDPGVKFEDQWFFRKMKLRGARLPSIEVARTFAVETLWYERPLGYHQVTRWQPHNQDKVNAWCPEYGLTVPNVKAGHV
ncbi:hypothetical protein PVAG01_10406 [Phlyctema vagabunda]|uniref:DUF5672 domain-containing protein n=1 Tax=Phlyctema vagabunda TaxID=108571 RepID=A0ABR4P5W9_9HELO